MTRTKNIKNNLTYNIIKFTAQLFLQFILRTVLIYYMGAEYLGLNGLFTNIFTFLNLAELGIGSAIVFSMYKPIADEDAEKVKALQNLYKKFYVVITIIVLILGIILLPFLKFFINGTISVD
ncbi:MAG: polysaccharide biosynthesis protein, partial [Clostridia bacterium]